MARPENMNEITQHVITDENTPDIQTMVEAVNYLDKMEVEAAENVKALALEIGYEGSLSKKDLMMGIKSAMRRSVESALEAGQRLLILKEITPHGQFSKELEKEEINERVARRFMAATLKFSKRTSKSVLDAAGTQTKMLELIVLDDSEVDALADGETVRGLTLDDIEKMSVSELKKALRASREETQLKIDIIKQKESKLNEQDEELVRIKRDAARLPFTDWPASFAGYFAYLEENRHELKRRIAMLEIIRSDAFKIEPQPGEEVMLEQAQKALADELVEMHNQCAEHLETIGTLFDKTLGAYSDKRINWIAQLCQR